MIPKRLKKFIYSEEEIDLSITTLQGGRSGSTGTIKTVLLFIVPMWTISGIWNFLPDSLMQMGVHQYVIGFLALLSIMLSIAIPVVYYIVMQNVKIQYLSGKDIHKNVFGWNPTDFDVSDMASKHDPEKISLGNDITTKSFLLTITEKLRIFEYLNTEEETPAFAKTQAGGN